MSRTGAAGNVGAIDFLGKRKSQFENAVAAMKGYELAQRNITSRTDEFTQKVSEQKATFRDLRTNFGQFNSILREQASLQNSVAIGWTKNAATGHRSNTHQAADRKL